MSLSVGQVVERVFLEVGKGLAENQVGLYRDAIQACIPSALNTLADMATTKPDYPLQQKRFTVSISAGIGALPSNCAIHTIASQGSVYDASGTYPRAFQYLPHETDLDLTKADEFIYYAIRGGAAIGGSIIIKAGTLAGSSPTSLRVTAGVYPTLANGYNINTTFTDLAVQHEDDLVNIIVSMVRAGNINNAGTTP